MRIGKGRLCKLASACAVALACMPAAAAARPGDLDPSFGSGGVADLGLPATGSYISDLEVLPDDRVVLAVSRSPSPDSRTPQLVRMLPDGEIDPDFGQAGTASTWITGPDVAPDELGVDVSGRLYLLVSLPEGAVVGRYLPGGDLDRSFSGDGFAEVPGDAAGIGVRPEGGVVVAWQRFVLALNDSGSPDSSFSADGVEEFGTEVRFGDVEVDPDGRVVLVGMGPKPTVHRLLPSGEHDSSFGDDGTAPACTPCYHDVQGLRQLELAPDGSPRILARAMGIERLNYFYYDVALGLDRNGESQPSFANLDASWQPGAIAADRLGGIVHVNTRSGDGSGGIGGDAFAVSHRLPDGDVDLGFGEIGLALVKITDEEDGLRQVGIQSDGRIVATGWAGDDLVAARFRVDEGAADRDADLLLDDVDRCPLRAAPAPSGCPTYRPRIALKRRELNGGERATIAIQTAPHPLCRPRSYLTLMQVRPGGDRSVRELKRGPVPGKKPPAGAKTFVSRANLDSGAYYATSRPRFKEAFGVCERASSNRLRVR